MTHRHTTNTTPPNTIASFNNVQQSSHETPPHLPIFVHPIDALHDEAILHASAATAIALLSPRLNPTFEGNFTPRRMTSTNARAQAPALALEQFNKSLKGQALESSIYSLTASVPPRHRLSRPAPRAPADPVADSSSADRSTAPRPAPSRPRTSSYK
ncbi:hypothetical protein IMZ48_38315 [Candidatus Bathyarchaeota archaeon]|nr:hypothetical protein [Candidatus Bathyarchaeota archaeon]